MAQIQETFLFVPTSVPGINAWYDGADPLGTGTAPSLNSTLATWVDKSGNARNASGGTSPTFVSGGVRFNGTSSHLTMTIPYSSNYSIFLVATNTTVPQTYFFARGAQAAGMPTFIQGYIGAGIGLEWYEGIERATIATTPVSPFMVSADHTQGASIQGYYYGTQAFNITQTSAYTTNVWNYLGQSGISTNWYGGTMKELIFYSNVVSTVQRQQIEGYLAWKWGLQANLPSNHPFKTYRPLANAPIPTSIPPMPLVTQGTAVFTPTQISGCIMWLDAADRSTLFQDSGGLTPITAQGQSIGLWRDKSSRGYLLTVPSGKTAPTYGPNVINTTGANALWSTTNFELTGNAKLTLFFVFASSVASGFNSSCSAWIGNPNSAVAGKIIGLGISVQGLPANYQYYIPSTFNSAELSTTQPRLVGVTTLASAKYDGVSVFGNYNGSPLAPSGLATSGGANWSSLPFQTGARYANAGSSADGFMCEVICYNDSLTDTQVQQVEGYLAWKWGLQSSLPVGYPYKQQPIAPFPFTTTPFRGGLNQWIPTAISGCSLWLDAADRSTLTVSGSSVSQWRDKSGTTNVSQANASLQPTYEATGFNGRPTLRVTGVQGSSFQELTTGTTNQYDSLTSLYMFCVYRVITPTPAYPGLFSIQNKVSYYLRGLDNGNNFGGQNVWTYNGASFTTNNDTIVTYDQNGFLCLGLDGGFQSTYLNGSFTGAPKAFSFGSGTSLILRIGYSGYNANDGFNGYISEVLVYKASLSTVQRQQVEGYLAWKWGLQGSLPATHPFKRWPPPPS